MAKGRSACFESCRRCRGSYNEIVEQKLIDEAKRGSLCASNKQAEECSPNRNKKTRHGTQPGHHKQNVKPCHSPEREHLFCPPGTASLNWSLALWSSFSSDPMCRRTLISFAVVIAILIPEACVSQCGTTLGASQPVFPFHHSLLPDVHIFRIQHMPTSTPLSRSPLLKPSPHMTVILMYGPNRERFPCLETRMLTRVMPLPAPLLGHLYLRSLLPSPT
jgi:hypothetical protein